jgi:hypothetical protein
VDRPVFVDDLRTLARDSSSGLAVLGEVSRAPPFPRSVLLLPAKFAAGAAALDSLVARVALLGIMRVRIWGRVQKSHTHDKSNHLTVFSFVSMMPLVEKLRGNHKQGM